MQYTIRGVPKPRSARKRRDETVSDSGRAKRRDLSDIAGTWKTDKGFESALAIQDEVDEDHRV